MQQVTLFNGEVVWVDWDANYQQYSCVSQDYDGAPDADQYVVGWGKSAQEAIDDYLRTCSAFDVYDHRRELNQ